MTAGPGSGGLLPYYLLATDPPVLFLLPYYSAVADARHQTFLQHYLSAAAPLSLP